MWLLLSDAVVLLLYVAIPLWLALRVKNSYLRTNWNANKRSLPLRLGLGFSACALAVLTVTGILVLLDEHRAVRVPKSITPETIVVVMLVLLLLSLTFWYATRQSSSLADLKKKVCAASLYSLCMSFWFMLSVH